MNFLEIILTDFYPFFFFFPTLFNLFSFFRENREEFCSSSRLEIILRISFRHFFSLSANFSIEFLEIILEMRKGKT